MAIPKRTFICLAGAAAIYITGIIARYFTPFFHIPLSYESFFYLVLSLTTPMSIVLLGIGAISLINALCFKRFSLKENEGANNDIEQLRSRLIEASHEEAKNKDILELMLTNMSEIKQYYSISKHHARLSFILALLFCAFGFVLLAYSVSLDKENPQPVIVGIIGGTVSELFAGTALLVHKSSLSQLNHYYRALHENERFLSTVNLVDRLSTEKRDEAIIKIIDSSLEDISSLVKRGEKEEK